LNYQCYSPNDGDRGQTDLGNTIYAGKLSCYKAPKHVATAPAVFDEQAPGLKTKTAFRLKTCTHVLCSRVNPVPS